MEYNSLSDKAYDRIREMIIACDKGQYLSIRDTAQQMGMSYTPVREAFQRLKNEGLLDLEPNIGFFVPKLDIKDLMQIYEARECVERFVFERAFDLLTKEDIARLRESVEKQKRYLSMEQIKEYLKEDEKFHLVFFEAYSNQYLTELVRSLRAKYLVCSKRIRSGSEIATQEHIRIIELIERGDRKKAADLMQEHVTSAKLRMMEGYISYNG